MNIEGLSEATLERLVDERDGQGICGSVPAERWRDRIVSMDGFGEKSFENLAAAAERASHTTPARLLFGLGIPNIGVANARMIARECGDDWERISGLTEEELTAIDGIGEVMAKGFVSFSATMRTGGSLTTFCRSWSLPRKTWKAAATDWRD